jgi:hypothetical protein
MSELLHYVYIPCLLRYIMTLSQLQWYPNSKHVEIMPCIETEWTGVETIIIH